MYRPIFSVVVVSLCGALAVGCSGGGSSSSGGGSTISTIPAVGAESAHVRAASGVRRILTIPSCVGVGANSFLGGKDGNVADNSDTAVLGGYSNVVCDDSSSIAGGGNNIISSAGDNSDYGFIGGGNLNAITGKSYNSVIAGGNGNDISGTSYFGFIGAGGSGRISGGHAFIGSGYSNTVSATDYGVIGGGESNTVSGLGGFVGSGIDNLSSGTYSTVTGGDSNRAVGEYATVPGGAANTANGELSFAAGHDSDAYANGTFVWSDFASGATQLVASVANEFLARASGGFILYTNAANTIGAKLAAGSGTWASVSDRNLKTDVTTIDDARVLDKVAALPVSEWSYTTERGVRHVGPMAQDFYAAFGVGEDNRHITSIDEDGVALAAIKALHRQNATLQTQLANESAQLAGQKTQLAGQRAQLADQNEQVAALRSQLGRLTAEVEAMRSH